jgi:hypothetical protein
VTGSVLAELKAKRYKIVDLADPSKIAVSMETSIKQEPLFNGILADLGRPATDKEKEALYLWMLSHYPPTKTNMLVSNPKRITRPHRGS